MMRYVLAALLLSVAAGRRSSSGTSPTSGTPTNPDVLHGYHPYPYGWGLDMPSDVKTEVTKVEQVKRVPPVKKEKKKSAGWFSTITDSEHAHLHDLEEVMWESFE